MHIPKFCSLQRNKNGFACPAAYHLRAVDALTFHTGVRNRYILLYIISQGIKNAGNKYVRRSPALRLICTANMRKIFELHIFFCNKMNIKIHRCPIVCKRLSMVPFLQVLCLQQHIDSLDIGSSSLKLLRSVLQGHNLYECC